MTHNRDITRTEINNHIILATCFVFPIYEEYESKTKYSYHNIYSH